MKQQLEQLLKDAEEVTAKMREALAQMDKPWIPKKGDWAEVVTVDEEDIEKGIKVGDIVQVNENYSNTPFCILQNGKRWFMEYHQLRHLPNYKSKHALAATYEEVAEAVRPEWVFGGNSSDVWKTSPSPYQLPTEAAAKQSAAFSQIKNFEAYCAEKFEGGMCYSIHIDGYNKLYLFPCTYGIIKVTREAAKWLIANHPEPFLIFFGVKS